MELACLFSAVVRRLPRSQTLPRQAHQIPYQEINIETTPGAADEVIRNTGKRAIPQFVIDGKWVQPYRPGKGFLYEEMSQLLGLPEIKDFRRTTAEKPHSGMSPRSRPTV